VTLETEGMLVLIGTAKDRWFLDGFQADGAFQCILQLGN